MRPILVFFMGATNAGKSTTMARIHQRFPSMYGMVEVGKKMRAKYPPEYFKGSAAPAHTAVEAWQMMLEGIEQNLTKNFILIDGQPRDETQCLRSMSLPYHRIYIHLFATLQTRVERALARDGHDPAKMALTEDRLTGDAVVLYELLSILSIMDQRVHHIEGDGEAARAIHSLLSP